MNNTEKHSLTYILKYAYECKEEYFVYIGNIEDEENEQVDYLIRDGWKGIFFNCKEEKINELKEKYSNYKYIKIINEKVTPENIIDLLNFHSVPIVGFLLLIDIKSYDYYILKSLLNKTERYRPDIIISSFNPIVSSFRSNTPIKFAAKFNEDIEYYKNYKEDYFCGYSLPMIEYLMEMFNYEFIDLVDSILVLRKCFDNEATNSIKNIEKLFYEKTTFYNGNSYDYLKEHFKNLGKDYLWIPTDIQKNSLVHYAKNIFSQRGDDGIIEEIFKRLNISNGVCIEFGAWDGIHLSNTRNLILNGWTGIMIEANKKLARQLFKNYEDNGNVIPIYGEVIPDNFPILEKDHEIKLKDLQKKYFEDIRIDFVSIDIDYNDVEIFEMLDMNPMPTVIALESGLYWNPRFTDRVSDEAACNYNVQQPLSVTIDIAKSKGYEPICFNQNLYLILKEYYYLFSDIKNDAITLWYDAYNCNKIFSQEEKPYIKTVRKENLVILQIEGKGFEEI